MAKSDKVSSSFTGVGDVRPSPDEKPSSDINFKSGTEKLKASPLSASYDSRPQVDDNNPKNTTIKVFSGKMGAVDAGRKSHSFGSRGLDKNDRY